MKVSKFRLMVLIPLLAIIVALVPQGSEAWGKEGHYATCKIAEPLLSSEAKKAVKELLPYSDDLPSMCSWADQMRFRFHWASPLHFIDTPDNECTYDYARDCHNPKGEKGMCVEGAINNYTTQLDTFGTKASNQNNLTQALLFLSHFMGDIHQPLHCGFTSDEGGNAIHVRWYRRKSNLHHVWDSDMIETAMKDYYGNDLETMIQAIQQNLTDSSWSDEVSSWKTCSKIACPNPYAKESIALACKYAYKDVEDGMTLDDDYFLSRLPIIEKQLAKGGVRLAATLNRVFGSEKDLNLDSEL